MNNTKLPAVRLLVDGCHGQYVPNAFVKNFDLDKWSNITQDDIDELSNTNNDDYWETWEDVLNKATFSQDGYTWRLSQDGDLWAICYELMTDEEKANFGFED